MRIAVGSDHRGVVMRAKLIDVLNNLVGGTNGKTAKAAFSGDRAGKLPSYSLKSYPRPKIVDTSRGKRLPDPRKIIPLDDRDGEDI